MTKEAKAYTLDVTVTLVIHPHPILPDAVLCRIPDGPSWFVQEFDSSVQCPRAFVDQVRRLIDWDSLVDSRATRRTLHLR